MSSSMSSNPHFQFRSLVEQLVARDSLPGRVGMSAKRPMACMDESRPGGNDCRQRLMWIYMVTWTHVMEQEPGEWTSPLPGPDLQPMSDLSPVEIVEIEQPQQSSQEQMPHWQPQGPQPQSQQWKQPQNQITDSSSYA
eukprot:743691-Amphidinium_carterae.3